MQESTKIRGIVPEAANIIMLAVPKAIFGIGIVRPEATSPATQILGKVIRLQPKNTETILEGKTTCRHRMTNKTRFWGCPMTRDKNVQHEIL
jgi:hypothetical protein